MSNNIRNPEKHKEKVLKIKTLERRASVIVLTEYQAVSTDRQGKLLRQNVYGAGQITG
jgi:hypothetical protein